MRIWVVVDASIVLSAGILTGSFCYFLFNFDTHANLTVSDKGILSACALCEKLSRDRILPNAFLYRLPATNAQAIAIAAFIVLCGALYASAGASLVIVSKMYVKLHRNCEMRRPCMLMKSHSLSGLL